MPQAPTTGKKRGRTANEAATSRAAKPRARGASPPRNQRGRAEQGRSERGRATGPAPSGGGEGRAKVAILGGGCAALTAAFELTRPEVRDRYDVTVYQMGFRLGGKGASGRGPEGRIEEHGLHVWLGFYENAFRLMRAAYGEAARDKATCPIAAWTDAFTPDPNVGVTDRLHDGGWGTWVATFPPMPGLPGDPPSTWKPVGVVDYLSRAVSLLVALIQNAQRDKAASATATAATARKADVYTKPREARAPAAPPSPPAPPGPAAKAREATNVLEAIDRLLRYGQLAGAAALFEGLDLLRQSFEVLVPRAENAVLKLVDAVTGAAHRYLETLVAADPELRHVWEVADLVLAILRGSLRYGLAFHPRGFDAINDADWRDWLRENGATRASLDSGFVRGIYDLVFAYEDGDVRRPRLAAGVALRGAMRMFFTYRGSLFYKMQAGMGDIVFAPLYEVLARRGVKFEFFHKVTGVRLADASSLPAGEAPHVAALEMDVQVKTKGGAPFRPLVNIGGVPSWPAEPDWSQLEGGDALREAGVDLEAPWDPTCAARKVLRVGEDFDFVVLGVSIGAIPAICGDILAVDARWRAMVANVKTVATQAFQLWMREDARGLGWTKPLGSLSGFVTPFDTWADMSHLLDAEDWRSPPRSIAYFCSVLRDEVPPAPAGPERAKRAREEVRANAVHFLEREMRHLWPGAIDAKGAFRWDLLATAKGQPAKKGEARFDTQFWTANVRPSDRYVLSLPGTIAHRISPLDMTYDNLTIAGDWTDSGLSSGCVESAVMSGMLAAHAIAHFPPLEEIVGYDHP